MTSTSVLTTAGVGQVELNISAAAGSRHAARLKIAASTGVIA